MERGKRQWRGKEGKAIESKEGARETESKARDRQLKENDSKARER